jgi:hypothetical protein
LPSIARMPSNSKSKTLRGKGRGASKSTSPSSSHTSNATVKKRKNSPPHDLVVSNANDTKADADPAKQNRGLTLVRVKPKLLKRFYEALVILFILGQSRGDKTDEEECETKSESLGLNPDKLRRAFIRNLAYLCDYKRGEIARLLLRWNKRPSVSYTMWHLTNARI